MKLTCVLLLVAGLPSIAVAQDVGLGRGVVFDSDDYALQIRGRIQPRFTARSGERTSLGFAVRRARLVLRASDRPHDLELYVQLGLGAAEIEHDVPAMLLDAAITWSGARDFSVRVGQMKVPFDRERLVSSSALQFVDRTITNAELTLDRDIGVQIFSNDLFGLDGLVGYQLGVFGGEGRNHVGDDSGLLYVARVQIQPLGAFDDAYSEADFLREARPRLSIALAAAYNDRSHRARSTGGDFFALGGFDTMHLAADLAFKYAGFSLQAAALARETSEPLEQATIDGAPVIDTSRSGYGFSVQAGYMLPSMIELAARYAEARPLMDSALAPRQEIGAALSWYVSQHDLKLQADYTYTFAGVHELRSQMQVYF